VPAVLPGRTAAPRAVFFGPSGEQIYEPDVPSTPKADLVRSAYPQSSPAALPPLPLGESVEEPASRAPLVLAVGTALVAASVFGSRPRAALAMVAREQASSEDVALDRMRARAKANLLEAIKAFNAEKENNLDGYESMVPRTLSITNGLTGGGELDKTTAAPVNLEKTFKKVSDELSSALEQVIHAVEALAPLSPTTNPTAYLGTQDGALCPLNGSWKNIFTTAADAVVKATTKDGERVESQVCNLVDGERGLITNMIDFNNPDMALKQLRVKTSAKAVSPTRVDLEFRNVRAVNKLPLLDRQLQFDVPVPNPAILRALFALRKKEFPQTFFDVMYLDADLRVQLSAQGALYVQHRAAFSPDKAAQLLISTH
jgi:hypothetical protein